MAGVSVPFMAKGSAARAIGIGIGRRHVGDDLRRRRGGRRGRHRHRRRREQSRRLWIAVGQWHDRGCRRHVGLRRDRRHRRRRQAVSSPPTRTKDYGREGEARQPAVAAGFRSGVGTVPVCVVASDAHRRRGLRRGGSVLPRGLCGCRVLCGGRRGFGDRRSRRRQPKRIAVRQRGRNLRLCRSRAALPPARAATSPRRPPKRHTRRRQIVRCARECVSSRRSVSGYDPASQDVPRAGEPRR